MQKVGRVVAVAATRPSFVKEAINTRWGVILAGVLGFCVPLMAAVLPEERADALYHSYSGGGVTINGPSILARKTLGKKVSVWGNYYVDSITSASIDVITTASQYTEERTEYGFGVDYLQDTSTLSLAFSNSGENDFVADAVHFSISQDMFGDLTTVSLGYSRGFDDITATGNDGFERKANRQNFKLGISQILTKSFLMELNFETISDEGYLNNPYRSVRYLSGGSYAYQGEVYPNTRTSHAAALRAVYYLPYRAAIKAEYRLFTDTWGIQANTIEAGYVHPFADDWIIEFTYRYYTQTGANFYSDLFPNINAQNYLARDKELSTFTDSTYGVSTSYLFAKKGWRFIDKGSANISYRRILFDYKDFRDLRVQGYAPGTEPLYNFSADVLQLYVSLWY